MNSFPRLGVGLGYREPFLASLFLHRAEVDFLEVTADHFFGASAEKAAELELLRSHFTLIPHGLNLSVGSAEGLDPAYVDRFAALVEQLNPPWWSEHIAFTRAGGVEIGHLAPTPLTQEALEVIIRNVREVQQRIPVPLILENITCTPWPGAEMSEPEFLRRLTAETGCGLLLDVTNLHINSQNHRFDPLRFLDELPLERIVQLHFVGEEAGGAELIDSHAAPTTPAVWTLLDEVLARAPVCGAILERDDRLPPLAELLPELHRARSLGRAHCRWD